MNYIGSKNKLSGYILETIKNNVKENLKDLIFCDLFAGTGIVGKTFKPFSKQIISNDLEYYSFVLNRNYISNSTLLRKKDELIKELNDVKPVEGFIFNNYCSKGNRLYFSDYNGKKIDGVRQFIENNKKYLSDDEYYFLLASLLESADKVANTASVYGAYLKKIKKTAQNNITISSADFFIDNKKHLVYNKDSNELIKEIKGDILYLDPPYNTRQYGANYHLLNTIAIYDNFIPKGKTGLRNYNKSKYCSKRTVKDSFYELIKNADFKYIFLSYNNEGLMNLDEIKEIMEKFGDYSIVEKDYNQFNSNKKNSSIKTKEYIHILNKK